MSVMTDQAGHKGLIALCYKYAQKHKSLLELANIHSLALTSTWLHKNQEFIYKLISPSADSFGDACFSCPGASCLKHG